MTKIQKYQENFSKEVRNIISRSCLTFLSIRFIRVNVPKANGHSIGLGFE